MKITQLITYKDEDSGKTYVDHGIDPDTCAVITLPNVPIEEVGAKWDSTHGYHLISE